MQTQNHYIMMKHIIKAAIIGVGILSFSSCEKEKDNTIDYQEYLETQFNNNIAYLQEYAKKDGVTVTETGLIYEVISKGTGEGKSPKSTDKVRCHYEGWLIDGTLFDSSVKRGEPSEFALNGVIAGWTEGLQYMTEGDKYRFIIPYTLGYGPSGYATIPPYATLIFEVELIAVL